MKITDLRLLSYHELELLGLYLLDIVTLRRGHCVLGR